MDLFLLCLKIFSVRIMDVSLGTIRTIFTVKGKRGIASAIGFIEVFIWFIIVREALNTDNTSIFVAVSYALGFAAGTYIGGLLSEKFIKGTLTVQVITSRVKDTDIVSTIRKEGYAVSIINIKGHDENQEKHMLFIEIDKTRLEHLRSLIKRLDDKAFIVINETKYVQNGFIK